MRDSKDGNCLLFHYFGLDWLLGRSVVKSWSPVDESQLLLWSTAFSSEATNFSFFFLTQMLVRLPWNLEQTLMVRVARVSPNDLGDSPYFSCYTNIRSKVTHILLNISTSVWWLGPTFCTNIHGSSAMYSTVFSDPLTFLSAPSGGSHLWFWVKYLNNNWIDWHFIRSKL